MAKKAVLGKGIASLLQNHNIVGKQALANIEEKIVEPKVQNDQVLMVSVSQIVRNPQQPRKVFREEQLKELAASIKENGVIQPLIVTKNDEGFELIAGERRLRASKLAGLEQVPVVVKRATDRERAVMAIIENVQRADLNCVEEALAYFKLMEDYKLTQEEVAHRLGKERSSVANFLRILKLPRDVVTLLHDEVLSFGHGKVLASIKDPELAKRFANDAIVEKLSVRELEKRIKFKKTQNIQQPKHQDQLMKEKADQFRQQLEQRTGFHFAIKCKKNGAGEIVVKYNNEAEFNDVYEFLLNR